MTPDSAVERPLLEVVAVDAGYGDVNILHAVSLSVRRGSIVAVVGPNGAGKSTLLKAIYGLVPPRRGEVWFRPEGEHDLTGRRPHEITALGMNYVPQLQNVFVNMSVLENLQMGSYLGWDRKSERLARILDWFPMLASRQGQRAGTLSGGQRHMLALARALMTDPRLLLLDEPSAGLAPNVVDEVFHKLLEINDAGIALVIVEQNARRSLAMADHGYVLDMGRNRFEGPGEELLHDEDVVELYLGGRGRLQAAGRFTADYEAAEPTDEQ